MSGVRIAAFSKYFGFGVVCAAVVCGRHAAYLSSTSSAEMQRRVRGVSAYASAVAALETYLTRECGVNLLPGNPNVIVIGKRVIKVPPPEPPRAAEETEEPQTEAA